jgi:hypothetical protein
MEDVPEKGQGISGTRTYRISDPANIEDYALINVKIDSEHGRILSAINWRGPKATEPIRRYATIELEWSSPSSSSARPVLILKKFICWEFLGLGGSESNVTTSGK